jgi:hypothetical protein
MKRLLPIILLASCTIQSGKDVTTYPSGLVKEKSHYYGSVGSKAKGIENSPEQGSILELDDSVSLRNMGVAATSMYSAWALLGAQESNNAVETTRVVQGARTDRAGIVSKTVVEKSKIDATVAKEAIKASKP